MKRRILDGLRAALPVDGVLLALHGAGVADGVEDIEGDLCVAVRELVGPATPIAAVYDLHGNMTEAMRDSCELTLPCKLYPHTDFHDRGVEAVALLREIIAGRLRPVTVMRRLPMLPYIVTTQEGFIPAEVNAVCAELGQRPGVIDCSWFHGFPYADIAAPCPAVVCTTTGDLALAERCADEVAQWIWSRREDFRPSFPSPAEGVAQALAAAHGPVVVNEYADNPGGGTPGDGTHLLRAVLDAQPAPGTCCFASINDAAVVDQARQAGVGATISVSLGGKQGRFQGEPLRVNATSRPSPTAVSSTAPAPCSKACASTWAPCAAWSSRAWTSSSPRALSRSTTRNRSSCTASTSMRTSSSPSRAPITFGRGIDGWPRRSSRWIAWG